MKKILMTAFISAAGVVSAYAQQDFQVGANIGSTMGVTAKIGLDPAQAIETVLGYNIQKDGIAFKVLYQYHFPIVDALQMYVGGGINIGGYHLGHKHADNFAIGLVPSIGLEYKLNTAPIALAFAYDPAINFQNSNTWADVAFKVRYRF